MRDQLEALEDLAKIDLGFRQLEIELEEINSHLENLNTDVGRIHDLLERERAQLAEAEKLRAQTAHELEDLANRITQSTHRATVAKNTRQSEAATREIEVMRRERDERVAKTAELDTVMTQVRESLARHESDFAALQATLSAERADGSVRISQIEGRRREQDEVRKTVAVRVRADLLRKYNSIRERKGTAVAEISGSVCRACNITIPPQLVAKLHAGNEIHQCPNCQRILVLRQTSAGV